jgi:hypothetical protein
MSERFVAGMVLFFYFFCGGFLIRQELKNKATEQKLALVLIELEDLKKKERITAQDVVYIQKLVIEGKQ